MQSWWTTALSSFAKTFLKHFRNTPDCKNNCGLKKRWKEGIYLTRRFILHTLGTLEIMKGSTHTQKHSVPPCHPPLHRRCPSPLPLPAKPKVALSRGNVRGQVYAAGKVAVTLGHGKGRHHVDSWLIPSLGRHSWVTAAVPPCGINIISWFLCRSLSLPVCLFLFRSPSWQMCPVLGAKGHFLKYT